jgi:hypothetical protein
MRYLNKIIFINSANISYAEIGIDGNVHFIGTQGVGKSTTLRAILFFYNADKLKLGIEKGKRTFDDYYLPHANSFIIYEVSTETGFFCVVVYKSQGRAVFRFVDGAYNRNNFINVENKAMSWDQIRNTFSASSSYSKKIERYEEYRDILYGNNKGLPAQFRKYALIESRQYQNLPRTIQNVFLNSKLEAEFIKQTIIMSLNEEDVEIDLNQYALHLQDFEQQLSDIGKWSERNRAGEVIVRLLAGTIAKLYTEVRFLEKEKSALIQMLIDAHASMEQSYPLARKNLDTDNDKLSLARKKVEEADQKFQEKKDKINKEIAQLDAKLGEAKRKAEEYERINILGIIERIGKKIDWESKKVNLQREKELLASRYLEITNKYDAITFQLENQLSDYVNSKNTITNDLKESFYGIRQDLERQYEKIIEEIEKQNAELKADAETVVQEKKDIIHTLNLKKRESELKRWYESEILAIKRIITDARQTILSSQVEISGSKARVESLQKQWELDIEKTDVEYTNKRNKIDELITVANQKIDKNRDVIAGSSNSFYEWLHENKPGWEETIGKVIDQSSILYRPGLSPKIVLPENNQFYGVELNLAGISTHVKTITDYEDEIKQLNSEITEHEQSLIALSGEQVKTAEKFKKKYQPQIKTLKDQMDIREYELQKATSSLELATIELDELLFKAESEQKVAIEGVKSDILNANQAKEVAEEQLRILNKNIRKQSDDKRRERDQKIASENQVLQLALRQLQADIIAEQDRVKIRQAEIKKQSNQALETEGADVERITSIEKELKKVSEELDYIDRNRDKVVEYKKDKRELFDQTDIFKTSKKQTETKLFTEKQRHDTAKNKLQKAVDHWVLEIQGRQQQLRETEEDLNAFDDFIKTDTYLRLVPDPIVIGREMSHGKRLTSLIATLSERANESIYRMNDLRSNTSKFLSNFSATNIFGFETHMVDDDEFLRFAESLREFLEEDKIAEFEKRTNEHFASLIFQLSKETTELVSKEATISKVINEINKDFEERNFAGVIKSINLRLSKSANKIVVLLEEIRLFNNEHAATLGASNLFSSNETTQNNKRAVSYLKSFADEIASSKQSVVTLSDTFELEFKIVENENDSGWVEKLTNVGSEGTDILVKAMINIMLLNVFKESASKRFKDFRLHCMMDEIGKLHPNNVKGILKFANDRNIVLVNSSPTSYNAVDYKHTYLLAKDNKHTTIVKKLITNHASHGTKTSASS